MRRVAGALVLGLLLTASGRSSAARTTLRPVVVVSLAAGNDHSAARRDQATVDRARRFLARGGVPVGRIRFEVLDRSVLAAVLVELDEAADPCGTARWRTALASLELDRRALVVVVGGTIRSPIPFTRRAGLTCSPDGGSCSPPGRQAGAVILSDRRPVERLDPAIVVVHEIGHAAGLGHAGEPDCCCGGAGASRGGQADVMQADFLTAAGDVSTGAVTLDDVALTPGQASRIAAYLGGA